MALTPGFSGSTLNVNPPGGPRTDLAPRPNLDMELRAGPRVPEVATFGPTMIHPRLPGRGVAADGAASQREQRLLQSPAPGARLSVPLTW